MSKRRDLETRIASLREIREIMASMKNLAMIETHKLARFQQAQAQTVAQMARALNAVRSHYPALLDDEGGRPAYLVFGSERGFCGAYNEQLLNVLEQQPAYETAPVIGVGSRLASGMMRRVKQAVCLPGASVADEVQPVLLKVLQALQAMRAKHGKLQIQVIHFEADDRQVHSRPLLPPVQPETVRGFPPEINVAPDALLHDLLEHYLFALSHAWFYSALTAENQQRMQHLEQADSHLERQLEALGKRRNALRQEEIIEEIEVILLSSEAVAAPGIGE